MNKTLLKQQTNNKIYNFKKDLSLHLKRSRLPASTTFLGKSFQWLITLLKKEYLKQFNLDSLQ